MQHIKPDEGGLNGGVPRHLALSIGFVFQILM
jgi:hypothetical protein